MTDIEKYNRAQELLELFEMIKKKEQLLNEILLMLGISETPDAYGDLHDWIFRQFGLLTDVELDEVEAAFTGKDLKKLAEYLE